jgi:hypothetical protein
MPVVTEKNARNSLKHNERMLWMKHQDGINNFGKWEEMFAARLRNGFNVYPNVVVNRPPAYTSASAPEVRVVPTQPIGEFSIAALTVFARARNLAVEDLRRMNGNLWVRTDDSDLEITKTLRNWGFRYRPGKGWWQ